MQSNKMSDLTVKKRNYLKRFLLQWLFPLLFFTLPLSISYDWGLHQINLPSEPFIGLAAILLFVLVDFKELLQSDFIRHPISLFSLIYLGWMCLTVPFSSDLVVSAKYVLVTLAHWWVFYVGFWYGNQIDKTTFEKWLGYYGFSFLAVILYTWYHHAQYDFRIDASVLVARPFYSDHALYSAGMCFFLFLSLAKAFQTKVLTLRISFSLLSLLFLVGIYWSYSRAAWLSLVITFLIAGLIIIFRKRMGALAIVLACLCITGFYAITQWIQPLEVTAESKQGSWQEQIISIVNFKSDVSNLERINRYRSAWRMFLDRPLTGFGPGTYAQAYLPYQNPEEMTRLSVTTARARDGRAHPFGRGGGAHSEYFQALSEMGLAGLFFWLSFLGVSVVIGLQAFFRNPTLPVSSYLFAMTLFIICYTVLGVFNNFLHSEKFSILVWLSLANLAGSLGRSSKPIQEIEKGTSNSD